jgi:RNA polymerase sigma factor (sigma-70 family)
MAYWKAAARYEPEAGASWANFAAMRIQGAVKDAARDADHLSRTHRREVKAAEHTESWLLTPRSLDEPVLLGGENLTLGRTIAAPDDEPDRDLRLTVDAALEIVHLADARMAAVLRLYYEQGWRDQDIGEFFGVGVSRVSQLRDEGRAMLRELLPLDLLDAA